MPLIAEDGSISWVCLNRFAATKLYLPQGQHNQGFRKEADGLPYEAKTT